jgi:rare lipoprotein A (peptidoglycan hydrolase)
VIRALVVALVNLTSAMPAIANGSLTNPDYIATDVGYSTNTLYGTPTITGERDLSWRSVGEGAMNRTCEQLYVDHPYIEIMRNAPALETSTMRASFYGNSFHGGILDDEDRSHNALFHECDATVVAYNSLPKGTVLRLTNVTDNGMVRVAYAVVQDSGGSMVSHRLDLSRGLCQTLDPLCWEKGVLRLTVEVLGRPEIMAVN